MSTRPSRSSAAAPYARPSARLISGPNVPVAGSQTSAVSGSSQPPTTSTRPSGRSVAVCPHRRTLMGPLGAKLLVAGTQTSAVTCPIPPVASLPPTTSTRPSISRVEVNPSPNLGVSPAGANCPAGAGTGAGGEGSDPTTRARPASRRPTSRSPRASPGRTARWVFGRMVGTTPVTGDAPRRGR